MAGQQGTYNHFADIQALEAERDKILEIYAAIKAGLLDLNKLGLKIDSAKGIQEIAEAEKTLAKIQADLAETNKKLAESERRLAQAREETAQAAKQSSSATEGQSKANKIYSASMDDNIKKQIELQRQLDGV